jgi:hypothetical protein
VELEVLVAVSPAAAGSKALPMARLVELVARVVRLASKVPRAELVNQASKEPPQARSVNPASKEPRAQLENLAPSKARLALRAKLENHP